MDIFKIQITLFIAVASVIFIGCGWIIGFQMGVNFIRELDKEHECKDKQYESFKDISADCYKYLEIN